MVELETSCSDEQFAKLLFETMVRQFHRHLMANPSLLPIALIKKGNDVEMQASKQLAVGACVVPIFFRKPHSMVIESEQGGVRPRNGVCCNVEWNRRSVSQADLEKFGANQKMCL